MTSEQDVDEKLQHLSFPNESAAYRAARNHLLDEEIELRRQIERVAAHRRALPPGGEVPQDYVFVRAGAAGTPEAVRMSHLFEPGKLSLAIYSFMFGPERERPCPGCTHMLDALDGAALHIGQRTNLWVVAKSPLPRLQALAKQRGWRYLRFLSTDGNSYDRDYFGDSTALAPAMRRQQEFKPGEEWDMPMLNVFQIQSTTIRDCWGQELLYVPPEPGQQYRHNDLIDPLWNLLDCLPEGRGDFEPRLAYA